MRASLESPPTPVDLADLAIPTSSKSLATGRVLVIAVVCALFIAVSVTAQSYLSMLGHGHSYWRMLGWQLSVSGLWAAMAPVLVRVGAGLQPSPGAARTRHAWWAVGAYGVAAILLHIVVTAELSLWLMPFTPVVVSDFGTAFRAQFEAQFATDILVYAMLLVLGRTVAVTERASRLALRESRLEAELARAHLEALRLEIQPHFLFNTLNSIAALIRLQANDKALNMVLGLGALMRSTVDRPAEHLTPLSAEVEFVRQYLDLQTVRFGERLEVEYAVATDALSVLVPSFLLQPLVENALRHGIARKPGRSRITIAAELADDLLRVSVHDDGVGLPPWFELGRHSGTGLKNIRVRLQQLYGAAAEMSVTGGPLEGTRAFLVIPSSSRADRYKETA